MTLVLQSLLLRHTVLDTFVLFLRQSPELCLTGLGWAAISTNKTRVASKTIFIEKHQNVLMVNARAGTNDDLKKIDLIY